MVRVWFTAKYTISVVQQSYVAILTVGTIYIQWFAHAQPNMSAYCHDMKREVGVAADNRYSVPIFPGFLMRDYDAAVKIFTDPTDRGSFKLLQ